MDVISGRWGYSVSAVVVGYRHYQGKGRVGNTSPVEVSLGARNAFLKYVNQFKTPLFLFIFQNCFSYHIFKMVFDVHHLVSCILVDNIFSKLEKIFFVSE